MRYRSESKEKANGVFYTPSNMADYVASEMIKYHQKNTDENVYILDPAVGQGKTAS